MGNGEWGVGNGTSTSAQSSRSGVWGSFNSHPCLPCPLVPAHLPRGFLVNINFLNKFVSYINSPLQVSEIMKL